MKAANTSETVTINKYPKSKKKNKKCNEHITEGNTALGASSPA